MTPVSLVGVCACVRVPARALGRGLRTKDPALPGAGTAWDVHKCQAEDLAFLLRVVRTQQAWGVVPALVGMAGQERPSQSVVQVNEGSRQRDRGEGTPQDGRPGWMLEVGHRVTTVQLTLLNTKEAALGVPELPWFLPCTPPSWPSQSLWAPFQPAEGCSSVSRMGNPRLRARSVPCWWEAGW